MARVITNPDGASIYCVDCRRYTTARSHKCHVAGELARQKELHDSLQRLEKKAAKLGITVEELTERNIQSILARK